MTWAKRQELAKRAIVEGDLNTAADYVRRDRLHRTLASRNVVKRLTAALIRRAANNTSVGNLAESWKDLTIASDIAIPQDADRLSKEKNRLVELTVEQADILLTQGRIIQAIGLLKQLNARQIRDWRADRISQTAGLIKEAERLAAEGHFQRSIQKLAAARNLRPDLKFIDGRMATYEHLQQQLKSLTTQLQTALLGSQWNQVDQWCSQLLAIAPNYQIALDAHRRYASRIRPVVSSSQKLTTGWKDIGAMEQSNTFVLADDTKLDYSNTASGGRQPVSVPDVEIATRSAGSFSFLLWVDGVGGYLVCCAPTILLGQAVPQANVDIPILADLRRRHARFESVAGGHIVVPLGQLSVDGKKTDRPHQLSHGQLIQLPAGVRLRYLLPDRRSGTARIEFASRHRTQPWSDAIILPQKSIFLGPAPSSHIRCPNWKHELVIFRQGPDWYCRSQGKIEIDSEEFDHHGPIQTHSRITGADFSLSLEPV